MRNYGSKYEMYDNVSFPVIIVNEGLSVEYGNPVAESTLASLCRSNSLVSLLSNEIHSVRSQLQKGEIVKIRGNFGGYVFLTLIPFLLDGQQKAFVLAEHSFSIYRSTDGLRDEKSIVETFVSEYDSLIRKVNGSIDHLKKSLSCSSEKSILPHIYSLSKNVSHVDSMMENLKSVMRLQSLFAENNVERIDLIRFLFDMDRIHGVFDMSGINYEEIDVLYNKTELNSVFSDTVAFLLEDSNGSTPINVSIKLTKSHALLYFSIPAQKRYFAVDKVFDLQNKSRKTSLFFVRKIVERRGGNVIFRKNKAHYEVLISVRLLLPQSYSSYLANDDLSL
jgi:hypothetical protein